MAAKSVEYWLDRLKGQLRREQLAALSIDPYLRVARHFLLHLQKCNREVQSVGPSDLQMYLRRQRYRYQRRYGRLPGCLKNWRSQYTGSLHRLLRLAQGQWPPTSPDDSMLEEFATDLAARGIHLPVARRYPFTLVSFWNISATAACRFGTSSPMMWRATFALLYESTSGRSPGFLAAERVGVTPAGRRCTAFSVLCKANGRPLFVRLPANGSGIIWRRPVTTSKPSAFVCAWPGSLWFTLTNDVPH